MANEVDILIRIKGDAETRIDALHKRLLAGGPIAQRFGQMGSTALQLLKQHGADAATVLGGIGNVMSRVGSRMTEVLSGIVGRLTSMVKWAALAGAAFLGFAALRRRRA